MRSAIAPTISAGVMMANMSWNIAQTLCETQLLPWPTELPSTPLRKTCSRLPRKGEPDPKRQAVAAHPPQDRHHARNAQALGENGKDVLAPHQAAVEQRQSRQGHEQHQRRRSHLPGVVARTRSGDSAGRVGIGVAGGVVNVGFQIVQTLGHASFCDRFFRRRHGPCYSGHEQPQPHNNQQYLHDCLSF